MKNTKRIRKFKYYLFKFKIHKILPTNKFYFYSHLGKVSKWITNNREMEFTSFPTKDFNYKNRHNLHQFVIDTEIKDNDIDYLEFGVAEGHSFKWWIEKIKNEKSYFYGFDTFNGLPEDWGPFKKGDMSNGNEPPKIDDNRHAFYQGVFQDTLHNFLKTYKSDKKKIIHLDADLYSATLFVLTTLSPLLNKGDILLFDEFNVPLHEYKAFTEWADSFYINYKVIGEVNNYYQVAIRIE